MSSEIYYFSGTGNSFTVAKDIAQKLCASLIPIASLMNQEEITTNADVIGIVFPVYYMEPPMIVAEFVRRLTGCSGKYIFAVCTYGGAAGASIRMLRRTLRSSGGTLAAAYGVPMPQNSFPKSGEDRQKKYVQWNSTLDSIIKNTRKKVKGIFYVNALLELAIIPIHIFITRPVCKKHFMKISNLPSEASYEEHKHAMDKNFAVNEKCGGCSICAKVCPVGNIKMTENKPRWLGHCEHCLACYNWCPNKAIEGGITSQGYYYLHPHIRLPDIIEQQIKISD